MDVSPQQPRSPMRSGPAKNTPRALFLIGMGFFELGFVVIVLLLAFGTLNYLNVLSISKVIPFLTFLPHLSTPLPEPALNHYVRTHLAAHYLPGGAPTQHIASELRTRTYTWSIDQVHMVARAKDVTPDGAPSALFLAVTGQLAGPVADAPQAATRIFEEYFTPANRPKTWSCNRSPVNAATDIACSNQTTTQQGIQTCKTVFHTSPQFFTASCQLTNPT